METKTCTKCGEEKHIGDFPKGRRVCKKCFNDYNRQWLAENPQAVDKYRSKVIEKYHSNAEYFRKKAREYQQANKEKVLSSRKEYYIKNRETILSKKRASQTEEEKARKSEYNKKYREKNKDNLIASSREYYKANKERLLADKSAYIKENSKEINEKTLKWRNLPALFESYAEKICYAEDVKKDESGKLLCKCTYCGKWYNPLNKQIVNRIRALNGQANGEIRLYCSNECKKSCPIFWVKSIIKGTKIGNTREVPASFRHLALEDRNYTCEKCGFQGNGLHVHHIEGFTEQPMFATDLGNVVVVCIPCHKEIHRQPGCRYADYKCA